MTLQRLLDDLRRLGNQDAALDQPIDILSLLDYCAVAGLHEAKDLYVDLISKGNGTEHD